MSQGSDTSYSTITKIDLDNVTEVPTPRFYPHLSSEDGKIFDMAICHEDSYFKLCDMTQEEIERFVVNIKEQLYLLKISYDSSQPRVTEEEK